ncbi:competence protein ComK [Gracilibacillus sp. YIM 98692]|uniref:competence protein ComK n=1 Tax=Gracilibacillus sp. YIM 98692 TaxID=2663532 RepID=UPI0013D19E0E|nr:competence protein ComK [Gracilibacillus sp. YIM 98692]
MSQLLKAANEVSPRTLAVIGKKKDGQFFTNVMEYNQEDDYQTTWSAQKVMDMTCHEFGISLRGLIEGSRILSGITHKPPIAIDRLSGMYFFPTESPLKKTCTWIAHTHVKQVDNIAKRKCRIVFRNGRSIIIEASYATLINQLYRTAQYRYLLNNKMEDLLQSSPFIAEKLYKKEKQFR